MLATLVSLEAFVVIVPVLPGRAATLDTVVEVVVRAAVLNTAVELAVAVCAVSAVVTVWDRVWTRPLTVVVTGTFVAVVVAGGGPVVGGGTLPPPGGGVCRTGMGNTRVGV